jgi:uncharacterized protein (TIRG00374 family)
MIFGLAVFGLYLYFFVGIDKLVAVVHAINPQTFLVFYGLAIASLLLVLLSWVSSWRTLLKALNINISLKNAFMYYWTGYFLDLIVPCQQVCGEVTRLYLVQKETKANYGDIGAAGITNRIIAYSVVFTGLTGGVVYLLVRGRIPGFASDLLILSWIGAFVYLSILFYLALSGNAAEKLAGLIVKILKALRIKKYQSGGLSADHIHSLKNFHEGFSYFRQNPRLLIKPIIYQAISYVLNFSVYVFVFYALSFDNLYLDFFILVYFLAGAIQDATSAFSVGGLEILLTSIFIFFGTSPAKSGVAATVLRSVIFWFPLLVGWIIIRAVGAKNLLSAKTREQIEAEQKRQT